MSILITLKKLFKVSSNDTSQLKENSENLLYLHEDDAAQIELLPAENLINLRQECKKISDFSNEHFVGNGWSDIYIRPEPPKTILDKGILVDDFRKPFIERGFTEKELRFSGMKNVPVNEMALTFGDLRIYYGFTDAQLNSIYFDYFIKDENLALFNSILLDLSNKYNLVLADWNKQDIFDARLQSEVERYHTS
jgi:hypothetical protein